MTWPHRLAFFALLVIGIILCAMIELNPNASHGRLAPRIALADPVTVARISASRLGSGPLLQLVVGNGRIAVLQNHSWSWASADGGAGPFGAISHGEGGYIVNAADAILSDTAMYVLDQSARAIHVFELSGVWRRTIQLRETLPQFIPARFAFRNNHFVVSGYDNSSALPRWVVLRIRDRQIDTLFSRSGSPFEIVIPVLKHDSVYAVIASNYEMIPILPRGIAALRRDPPEVPLPPREQSLLNSFIARLPGDQRKSIPLPRTIPIVISAAFTEHGSMLTAITRSVDDFIVEEIDSRGLPLHTLEESIVIPFALTPRGIYTTHETMSETFVLYRALR